jgi:transposase
VRIRGKSKIDPHSESVLQMWRENRKISEIHKNLRQEGCDVGRSAVGDWIKRKVESGEFSAQVGSDPPLKATAHQRNKRSLSLLDAVDDSAPVDHLLKILRILWLPSFDWTEGRIRSSLGPKGFDLRFNSDGEPDFSAYARETLGRRRVESLGDMDFVLFALWTRKIRNLMQTPATDFAAARLRSNCVLEVAVKIRAEMFAAVSRKRTGVASK